MTAAKVTEIKDRPGMTQLGLKVPCAVAREFKDFCWEHRMSQIEAFERAFDLLRQVTTKANPSMDPKCRMLADAFKIALREAKQEHLL